MGRNDDLREEIKNLEDTLRPGAVLPGGADTRMIRGFGIVTKSVLKLEETSYYLMWVNIILAGLLAVFAVLQIFIMLHQEH